MIDAARPARTRLSRPDGAGFERAVVVIAIPSAILLTRFGGNVDDPESGSLLLQVCWSLAYCAAVCSFLRSPARGALLRCSIPLLALAALMVLSTVWSINPWVTFKNSIEAAGTTAIAYYIVSRFSLRQFVGMLSVAMAVIAVSSLAFVLVVPSYGVMQDSDMGGAWSGIYRHKNFLGSEMALGIVTLIALSLSARGAARWGTGLALAACALLLAGSKSATGFVACVVALGTFGLIRLCCTRSYGRAVALTVAGVVATAVALVAVLGTGLGPVFSLLGRDGSFTGRSDFWPGIVDAISDRPLLGYGYNAFFRGDVGGPRDYYLASYFLGSNWQPVQPHNGLLQILLDGGLVGGLLVVVALIVGITRAVRLFARHPTEPLYAWPALAMVYFVMGNVTESAVGAYNDLRWIVFVIAFLYSSRPGGPRT